MSTHKRVKLKSLILSFLLSFIGISAFANIDTPQDSINSQLDKQIQVAKDSVMHQPAIQYQAIDIEQILADYEKNKDILKISPLEDYFTQTNPFFIDLVFHGFASKAYQPEAIDIKNALKKPLDKAYISEIPFVENQNRQANFQALRDKITRKLAAEAPYLIACYADELPDVSDLINIQLTTKPIDEFKILDKQIHGLDHGRIVIEKIKPSLWNKKSHAMLQFSQSYISSNWHKGGSDYISILGIINGTFNYDNKKNIQWDNFGEWRAGFNSVEGDTLRLLNTNDDVVRATSKLGIKAGGNWFYSTSMDFSTQLFNSYTGINSTTMKVKFLTPVRFNMGVGLDYKYKKIFSAMISPLSYKYIYANDTINVNKGSFGIKAGTNVLSQFGSSVTGQLSYSPVRDLQIDSKLYFYTNYEKIEVDWEIIGNFRFNRYLTTRISLNPRYDNTVFLATGEKAKIQFKELLTFGLSYRIL